MFIMDVHRIPHLDKHRCIQANLPLENILTLDMCFPVVAVQNFNITLERHNTVAIIACWGFHQRKLNENTQIS